MRNLLIVSPHFPPVDTADAQRVRMCLPHFKEFGWRPTVLTIADRYVSASKDSALLDLLPSDTPVVRVPAIPGAATRLIGVGDAGLRAFPFLLRAGLRIIDRSRTDLVYFSTTQFFACTLGPIWKRLTGVPLVFDMQDPWVNDYEPPDDTGLKRRVARWLHRRLELVSMPSVDGIISVSRSYIDEIASRHPALGAAPSSVLPFGVSPADFEAARRLGRPNGVFDPCDDLVHGVYVGRGGADMARSLRIIFSALRIGLREAPESYSRVRLHFVGTDYAPAGSGKESVLPIARENGVEHLVEESPARVPYLDSVNLLTQSDFLLVPGSDDPRYVASKIVPYVFADKPLLAVFNESSPVVSMLEDCGANGVVRFGQKVSDDEAVRDLSDRWRLLFSSPETLKPSNRSWLRGYYPDAMAERQCRVFDEVRSGIGSEDAGHGVVV